VYTDIALAVSQTQIIIYIALKTEQHTANWGLQKTWQSFKKIENIAYDLD
jgi:hypothetical protein